MKPIDTSKHKKDIAIHETAPDFELTDTAGNPVKLSDSPCNINMTFPAVGEHSEDILLSLGYSQEDIEDFRREGVI